LAETSKDEEMLEFGVCKIVSMHTPGHTLESTSYLLIDSNGTQIALFSGDTIFLGEVGRPDLAAKSDLSDKDLAGMLYESIQKVKKLDDDLIIFPGHGAGSACGKNIQSGSSDFLKNQRKTNYALNDNLQKEEFIEIATSNIPSPPQYFFYDVMMNKSVIDNVSGILSKSNIGYNVEEFQKIMESDPSVVVIDTRATEIIAEGFIKGSVCVSLSMTYAIWIATLYKPSTNFLIVADKGKEAEAITRLARVGFEKIIGYLEGGFSAWVEANLPISTLPHITKDKAIEVVTSNSGVVVDVREKKEWESGVIDGSILVSLSQLENELDKIPSNRELYVVCRSGARAALASSILKKRGFENLIHNVEGGIMNIVEKGFKLTNM